MDSGRPEFTRDEIVDARFEDGLVFFTLAGRGSWYAGPGDLGPREALELLGAARRAGPSMGIVKADYIDPDDARNALAEIQVALYFERDNGGFRWNPEKASCPDAIAEVDEIMRRHGLHPTSGPTRRPHVHRP